MSVRPTPNFDGKADAEALRKAMKGLGTDDKVLIDILGTRTTDELQKVALEFKTLFGRDLAEDVHSETSGNYRAACLARLKTHSQFDADSLREAIAGAGTDEAALIEILASRSNAEIKAIREQYKARHKKDLEADISGDTSGDFKRLLISLSQGNRSETAPDAAAAAADAQALYKAGEGKIGTDEEKFNQILASRSFAQLKLINEEYKKISKKSLIEAVDSEFSGWVKDGLIAVLTVAINPAEYFATRLHASMKGAGTDDRSLIRLVVTRSEFEMPAIKDVFAKKYGKSLAKFIEEDTSGDYKKLLIRIVGN